MQMIAVTRPSSCNICNWMSCDSPTLNLIQVQMNCQLALPDWYCSSADGHQQRCVVDGHLPDTFFSATNSTALQVPAHITTNNCIGQPIRSYSKSVSPVGGRWKLDLGHISHLVVFSTLRHPMADMRIVVQANETQQCIQYSTGQPYSSFPVHAKGIGSTGHRALPVSGIHISLRQRPCVSGLEYF